jgi:hypothetical protein
MVGACKFVNVRPESFGPGCPGRNFKIDLWTTPSVWGNPIRWCIPGNWMY